MTVAQLEERATDRVELVAIDLLDPAPDNPRRNVGDVTELAQTIRELGLLEPLVVTPRGDRYLIVCGARRHAGCREAGLDAVTCVIREFSEAERQEAMLIENVQRTDLTVLEEAESYRRLVELGHTQRQLAERVGRSQAHVSKRVALLELPKGVLKELDSGGITLEDAQQLGKLTAYPDRLKRAFEGRKTYGGVAHHLAKELEELELEAAIESETAAIKKEGIPLLQMSRSGQYSYGVTAPKGTAVVESGSWDGVDMKPAEHAKLDCHAAAVHPFSGKRVAVCRDPAKHGRRKSQGGSAPTAAQKKRKEHDRHLAQATKARHAFLRQLLKRKPAKADAIERIVDSLIREAHQAALRIACTLLELEPERKKNPYGADSIDYAGALRAAAKTEPDRLRVGLAVAAGAKEESIATYWSSFERHKPYFEQLAANGYEISKPEQLELDGKAPRR